MRRSPPEISRATSGSPFEESYGFSRALRVGQVVHVAGTGPVWPDGSCDPGVGVQTRRCFEIIADALSQVGAGITDVVRTRMYLTDAGDAAEVGAIHGELFKGVQPAATMIVVAGLLDPRWRIEIEADAQVRR